MNQVSTAECAFCLDPCSLACANCKKVSYCSKNHQQFGRKAHRPICFPAKLEWSQNLRNHLVATRDIKPGEVIFEERPLVLGPRSNIPKSDQICLGCCDLIPKDKGHECPKCHWPLCRLECHQNPWHQNFECQIFTTNRVPRPTVPDDYLFVTILRCVLLQQKNPEIWAKFTKFESHENKRKGQREALEKSYSAANFIQNKCSLESVNTEVIDRIYGTLTVNGYSDWSKYYIKLYDLASKISHSCLPNTRSMTKDSKLVVISTHEITAGQPLTQLYGNLLTGTHRRQEVLQNVYHFTCACTRCVDPTELGTNLSGILCQTKKCRQKGVFVLPQKPLELSSPWVCPECKKKWTYVTLVFPALKQVAEKTQMTVDDPLFSEFEFYTSTGEVLEAGPEVAQKKADYVMKINEAIEALGKDAVNPNHYSLLPAKTAMISTIYSLLSNQEEIKGIEMKKLAEVLLRMVKNVLAVLDRISPGLTRNRGILLFYLARGFQIWEKLTPDTPLLNSEIDIQEIWAEAENILMLEPPTDDFRLLMQNHIVRK